MSKSLSIMILALSIFCNAFSWAGSGIDPGNNLEFKVPEGKCSPVLVDGIFSAGEWDDATKMNIHDSGVLYFKKIQGHIYIGLKLSGLNSPFVDLFITTDKKKIYQLHVSAQLGERALTGMPVEGQTKPFRWGYTKDWYANEVRWDEGKLRQLVKSTGKSRAEIFHQVVYPFDGFEFQLRKSKFKNNKWLFKIKIGHSPHYDQPILFPAKGEFDDLDSWAAFILD